MAGFTDPIVGGTVLRIPAIQSPNFVSGSSGWQIAIDGSAEFNNLTIRGTFNGTNFVINTSGAFFYSGTPALGNLTTSISPAAGTDALGNAYPEGFTNYNRTSNTFVNIDAGQMLIGALIGGTADLFHASSINQSGGGLTLESGLHAGAGQDQGQIIAVSGPQNQPVVGGPLITVKDTAGNSAVGLTISGPVTSCDLTGNQHLWQTPGMATGYTNSTMKYRLDAMDQVKWVGQFTQTTGVVGAGAATVINAVPAAYRPKTNWIAPCAWLSSGNVAKGAGILIFKTDGTVALEWPATTANGDQFGLSVSLPLDNIS